MNTLVSPSTNHITQISLSAQVPIDEGRNTMWYKQNMVLFSQEEKCICETCRTMERTGEVLSEMSDHKDKYRYSLTFKIQMEKDMNIEGVGRGSWIFGNHRGRQDMGVKHDQHV